MVFRGLFMNKYIFPGADASCSLGWVITQLESAGFEVKNIDVLGVHYSATIYHWYKNWVSNKDKVIEAYGDRWYRIWVFFLAWSVLIARFVVFYLYCTVMRLMLTIAHRHGGCSRLLCTRTSMRTHAFLAFQTTLPSTLPPRKRLSAFSRYRLNLRITHLSAPL
jgi:Mycolic acid cyclopropane synthetase